MIDGLVTAKPPTMKTRILTCLRCALLPLSTPEIVRLTGLDRRDVWGQLALLLSLGAVRRVNGRRPAATKTCVRWKLKTGRAA